MPAKHLIRVVNENTYSHIYNNGIDNRSIFIDQDDYEVFLSYLKEYLTDAPTPESRKTTFVVKGKTYQGTPHLPKNYVNKVELVSFRLMSNQFHLVLHQLEPNIQTNFLRSLCTRYSMYFNKKYNRSGPLFSRPYKSIHIENPENLGNISRGIFLLNDADGQIEFLEKYSSYLEFIGKRHTPWIKTPIDSEGLIPTQLEVKSYKNNSKKSNKVPLRVPVFAAVSAFLYVVLIAIGFIRLDISQTYNRNSVVAKALPTASPSVAGVQTEKKLNTIKILLSNKSISTNLLKEATETGQIARIATDGEVFELLARENNWYKVRLEDGSTAYVPMANAIPNPEE